MEDNKLSPGLIAAAVAGVLFCGCMPLTLLAMGGLGFALYQTPRAQELFPDEQPEPPLGDIGPPATAAVHLDGSEPSIGSPQADIELVQFSDFQCPYCSTRFEELVELTQRSSWLRLQFKHYPLSNICNPNLSVEMHEHACDAAKAADCAHEQDLFWPMAAEMFANQDALGADDLAATARSVGLRMPQYQRCMDQGYTDGLLSDIESASAVNIRGTPAIYAHVIATGQWYQLTGDLESELEQLRSR